jgi:catechol 2,3-dioxygenase-like lactoylglutathione lyase family enzyme
MRVTPIRYVRDLPSARRFYEALGLGQGFTSRPTRHGHSMWSELEAASGALALHHVPEGEDCPAVELALEATEPLEDVIARLRAAGYEPETELTDESFGLSFRVRDPEGLLIQVNKHDHDLQR